MGFATADIARTGDDFAQCLDLERRHSPDAMVPDFGAPLNSTLVIRDGDDPTKIVGMIHIETAHEVRSFIIDPNYKYQDASSTILFNSMEMALRVQGVRHYYFNVPREHEGVIKLYRKMGAQPIDPGVVRFIKKL